MPPASSSAAGRRTTLLLRDYVAARLTAPRGGYFSSPAPPVASLPAPIDFAALPSRSAWTDTLAAAYARLERSDRGAHGAWLTPAELFTPHYGAALAAWALEDVGRRGGGAQLTEIVEIGSGAGALARDVLSAVRARSPSTYAALTYTTLDVSPVLSAAAAATVAAAGHADRHRAVVGDARDAAAWPPPPPGAAGGGATLILACEVLDNLPHDRVRRVAGEPPRWEETVVDVAAPPDPAAVPTPLAERARPVADPLVLRALAAGPPWADEDAPSPLARAVEWALRGTARAAAGDAVWLPTGALALFAAAFAARSTHTLLAADFDALPSGPSLPGRGGPIVAARGVDLPSLLAPPPDPAAGTDILFPSDFGALARLYACAGEATGARGAAAAHCKSAAFLRAALGGAPSPTATGSGWDPMLDDFENTSVLVGRSTPARAR